MASNGSTIPKTVNSNTWKIHDRRMSKWMPMMEMYKELLPMACLRQNWQKVLTESQIVGKRQSP